MPVVEDSDQVLPLLKVGDEVTTDEGPGVLVGVQFQTAQYNGKWELEPPQLEVDLDSGKTIYTCLCSIELPNTQKGTKLIHQEFKRLWPPQTDGVPEDADMLIPEGDEEAQEEIVREGEERTATMMRREPELHEDELEDDRDRDAAERREILRRPLRRKANMQRKAERFAKTKKAGCGCRHKESATQPMSRSEAKQILHTNWPLGAWWAEHIDPIAMVKPTDNAAVLAQEAWDSFATDWAIQMEETGDTKDDIVKALEIAADEYLDDLRHERKANMQRKAETFRGLNLDVLPEIVEEALNEIKSDPEMFDTMGNGFEYWADTLMSASGRPEDYAEALGIDLDDPEWQESVREQWEFEHIMDAESEINDKLYEVMERLGLPGGLHLGSHEGDGSYGIIYYIDYDEAEQEGVVIPAESARYSRW